MSIIGSNILAGAAGSGVSAYEIEQSLRFDDGSSSTLTRTPSSNGGSVHTTSAWIKASDPSLMANIFAAYPSESAYGTSTTYDILGWYSEGPYSYVGNGPGNESALYLGAIDYSYKFRDSSAWYHVVWVSTSTQFQIYINGVLVASKSRTQNNSYYNQNKPHRISAYRSPGGALGGYINCYMAEVHFIDGQALDHEDFGEFDDNGVWRPIEYAGTYGTNGYYLKFDPSATNGVGHDHSGNGNNWTPSGFTTSGTGTDVMSDTPTTNYPTINPLETFNGRWSNAPTNGNLEISIPSDSTLKRNYPGKYASIVVPTTGKYYFEFETNQRYTRFVAVDVEYSTSVTGGNDLSLTNKKSVEFNVSDGNYYYDGPTNSTASGHGANTAPSGDIYGVAIDLGNGTLRVDLNGTAGTELDISSWAGESARVAAYISASSESGTIKYNFGAQGFAHTPPTGFKSLNTSNLPAPDIADGSDYFDTVLWNGNQTARTISMNSTFTPDFIWIKNRTSGYNHSLQDNVRGYGPSTKLNSNTTAQENAANTEPQAGYVDSVAAGSFDIDASATATWYHNNLNSNAYVGWCWDAGGSGSSNTDGSITSTVSANPTAGFSIVSYSGTSTDNATIGHGLGVAPAMVIVKCKSSTNNGSAGAHWLTRHQSIGMTGSGTSCQLFLNLTNGLLNNDHGTLITSGSNLLQVKASGSGIPYFHVSETGQDYIAYCFAEVEGYSKFGSYTGNGSTDGPFVFTGMAPAFILVKQSSGGENWLIFDTTRKTFNENDTTLSPNVSSAEVTSSTNEYDILSNGFKARNSSAGVNQSGQTYIFAAFAEHPTGGSGVSPVTAR